MIKNLGNTLFVFFISLLISACSSDSTQTSESDVMMVFQETELGSEPFITRVLVSNDFMRLDEGDDASDFTLLDRNSHIIYTVTHAQQRIMQITPRETDNKVDQKLVMDAKKISNSDIPEIEGQQPLHYQLQVNDKVCSEVYVIKDFSPQVSTALREFQQILASIHLANLNNTPVEMLDDCFLAHDVKTPSRNLQFGFPILQRDENGSSRLLVDYDHDFQLNATVFDLPKNYRMTDMSGAAIETNL